MDESKNASAVIEVLNKYAEHFVSGNFEAWMNLWADDGVQMPPGASINVGREQIHESMKPVFDQFNLEIELKLEEGKVYGDYGMTRCTYSLALIPKAGGETVPAMPDGKALTIYRRQPDDTWKIIYDCFNSNITQQP